jgi:beta-N-acetylhexosaminidase
MGPLMLDLSGCELTPEEKDLLDHPLIGGVILFSRNYHDQKQLKELVEQLRMVTRNRVLIATDHEGGRVQRFRQDFSLIPAMGSIYKRTEHNIDLSKAYCEQFGWLMAAELLAFDIDISFAPVLDVDGVSEVIGDRGFDPSPEIVVPLASEFIKGMHRAGMKSTGKHFPGHGSVVEDSHIAMPIDLRSEQEIVDYDMRIFSEIHKQGLLDAVMPAHVIYPQVDELPAGFSKVWMQKYLRGKMQFDGVIFSDDLSMQGAVQIGNIAQRADAALVAGCDMVLVCNNPNGAAQVIDSLPSDAFVDHPLKRRLARLAKASADDFHTLRRSKEYKNAQNELERFYAN